MNNYIFAAIYLTLLTIEFITLYTLTLLNINSVLKNRDNIPDIFKSIISPQKYEKSIAYTLKKEHFSIFRLVFSLILTVTILFSGILGSIESILMGLTSNKIILGLLFLGVVSLILGLFDLPLSLYSTFVIEEEFGFNKLTIKAYIGDIIKQIVLSLVLGIIILTTLFIFMDKTADLWWLWASIFFISFQLLLLVIYPNFIAPIFNKFSPLEDGELKNALEEMAVKANFKINGIYVMDGSKRSGHSNAYFTGIGSSKRIVLYDTLIENLSTEELCGVLAHEIGHWSKGHIKKRLILTFISVPLSFFILSLALNFKPLYTTFNMVEGTYHGLLVLMMLISSSFTFFFSPLSNLLSRKHEFEADSFAKNLRGESDSLIQALLKLSKDNLSNLTPDKNYSAFHYSHPPVIERVKNLKDLVE